MINVKALCVRCRPGYYDMEDEFVSEPNGIASFGWSSVKVTPNETAEELFKRYASQVGYEEFTLHAATQIINFKSATNGTILLVPSIKDSSQVHLLEVTGPYFYDEKRKVEGEMDAAHTLPVRHIKSVDRSDLPESLQKALYASRRAVSNFSKYSEEVNWVLNPENKSHTELPGSIIENARDIVVKLMNSNNEQTKLQAAQFILQNQNFFD